MGVDWPPKNATRDVLVFSPQTQLVRDHLSLSTPLPAVGLGNNSIPSQLRLYRLTGQEAPLLANVRSAILLVPLQNFRFPNEIFRLFSNRIIDSQRPMTQFFERFAAALEDGSPVTGPDLLIPTFPPHNINRRSNSILL